MKISRRDFIKTGGKRLLGGIILYSSVPALMQSLISANVVQAVHLGQFDWEEHYWKFVVDITKCIGCGKCVRACKLENDVPLEPEFSRTWVERYVISENDEFFVDSPEAGIDGFIAPHMNIKYENLEVRKSFFVPKLCNQCEKPPCVQVCPVAATYMNDEGLILIDRKACVGCGYCIQACPYRVRFLDPRLKVADKCTWCYHRITKGLSPACVEVCPVGARALGDIRDPEDPVRKIIQEQTVGVLKPWAGCEPKVFYVGLEKGVH